MEVLTIKRPRGRPRKDAPKPKLSIADDLLGDCYMICGGDKLIHAKDANDDLRTAAMSGAVIVVENMLSADGIDASIRTSVKQSAIVLYELDVTRTFFRNAINDKCCILQQPVLGRQTLIAYYGSNIKIFGIRMRKYGYTFIGRSFIY